MYLLIISEKSRDPWGRSLEILGAYNPYSKDLQVKADRIKYWLDNGAQMSDTVNNLLVDKKIISGEKIKKMRGGKKAKSDSAAGTAKV